MGKKSNERRKRIFAELREQGKLAPMPRRTFVKAKSVEAETVRSDCCLVRYAGQLPNGFRMCRGCTGP
jgi:hypothetical protein